MPTFVCTVSLVLQWDCVGRTSQGPHFGEESKSANTMFHNTDLRVRISIKKVRAKISIHSAVQLWKYSEFFVSKFNHFIPTCSIVKSM